MTSSTDRLKGMIYGAALGSAAAVACEGRDAHVLRDNFAHAPATFDFPRPVSRGRIRGYPPNDWAGDLDQAVLVMRAVRACGECDAPPATRGTEQMDRLVAQFSALLLRWSRRGFPSQGDQAATGVDGVTRRVVAHGRFAANPRKAARETAGAALPAGAPLIRAIPLAALPLPALRAALPAIIQTTHTSPVTHAAALFETLLLGLLLGGAEPTPELARLPVAAAAQALPDPDQRATFLQALREADSLEAAGFEFEAGSGTAPKTARAIWWAYRQLLGTPAAERTPALFEKSIRDLSLCGRRATEHCAVAGALLGAALGFSNLPPAWVEGLAFGAWLGAEVESFAALFAPADNPEPARRPDTATLLRQN